MRKTLIIITVGIFIALFPLLALPPRMEAWILLIIGASIVIFGLYERIVHREKNNSTTSHQRVVEEETVSELDTDQDENLETEPDEFSDEEELNY